MGKYPVIELHFLPSIAYFSLLKNYGKVVLEVNDFYEKQSYRNRCYVLGPNKVLPLIVPIQKGKSVKPFKEVKIDYSQKWQHVHWKTIASCYGKAPYFEYFAEEFYMVFQEKTFKFLIDLDYALLSKCLKLLGINVDMSLTNSYFENINKGALDLRNGIHPKKSFNKKIFFHPFSYNQLFGKDFVPNLSVLDLLFCEGPNAANVLGYWENKQK